MVRQVAFLMRASKGGLTHSDIMKLTWRQFHVYLDSFTWLVREENEDGRKQNRRDDLEAMKADPAVKAYRETLAEETRRIVERHKKFAETKKGRSAGAVVKKLL